MDSTQSYSGRIGESNGCMVPVEWIMNTLRDVLNSMPQDTRPSQAPATFGKLGCLCLGNGTDHAGPFCEAVHLTVFVENIKDEVLGVLLPTESPP